LADREAAAELSRRLGGHGCTMIEPRISEAVSGAASGKGNGPPP
jgi:hypothetical protein